MNPLTEEYRFLAAYCEEMADNAASPELKAEWLRLAGNWLALLPYREPALPHDFDAMAPEQSTRQGDSTPSH
jgi:hypothetical protein